MIHIKPKRYEALYTHVGAWITVALFFAFILPALLADIARRNVAAGRHADAFTQMSLALFLSPSDPQELLYDFGRVAHKNGELELAIRSYTKLLQDEPDWRDANLELARVLFVKGGQENLKKAVLLATTELRFHPENVRAYYVRGLIYGQLKQWDSAEKDFEAFTQAKPDSPWGWNDLAWIYFSKGEWTKAEDAARRSIQIDKDFMWGYNGLGLALLNQGRYAEAADTLEVALDLARRTTPSDYLRAYPGNNQQFAPRAPEAFQAGIAFNLGLSYIKVGHKERAVQMLGLAADLLSTSNIEKRVGISRSEIEQKIMTLQQ